MMYRLDIETVGSTAFINLVVLRCSDPSIARALLRHLRVYKYRGPHWLRCLTN